MGKLMQALKEQKPTQKGTLCTVRLVLNQIDEHERAELNAALNNQMLTSVAIASAMHTAYGFAVRKWVVQRHRRNECACSEQQ